MSRWKLALPLIGAMPVLLLARFGGPPAGVTGAPGENSCTQCHAGTVNTGGGSVTIETGNYTPGRSQVVRVRVANPTARLRWGFQLTARLASNPAQQAGSFTARANQAVQTSQGLQYINHAPGATQEGTSFTFEVDWTAPATNVGDVVFYAAANAANGTGSNAGDSIYTGNTRVSAGVISGRPSIRQTGVITAGDFGGNDRIAAGSWIEIYGSNLSGTTREWRASDFTGDRAPTALDNVGVTINGRAAFVRYVSPDQVNVQAPEDTATGTNIQVIVTNDGGSSEPAQVLKQAVAPALLAPAAWRVSQNKVFVFAAVGRDVVGVPAGTIAGVTSRPARPGETITFYGVGFGPVVNATGQAVPAGTIARGTTQLVAVPTFRFGSSAASLTYAGLTPDLIGLYQFNVVVPAGLAAGEYQVIVEVGGEPVRQALTIDVRP